MPDLEWVLAVLLPAIIAAIIAITFHEAAHGLVAYRLGDPTAYQQGRVTLNPFKHIDPFGTVILPVLLLIMSRAIGAGTFFFGWAKPVPVTPSRLNNPRRDMIIVAAAGPVMNILLALISGILLTLSGVDEQSFLHVLLKASIFWNAMLAVFNLIPLPPLDGGRIAVGLLPGWLAYPLARLERHGLWIVIGVFFILPLVTRQLGY